MRLLPGRGLRDIRQMENPMNMKIILVIAGISVVFWAVVVVVMRVFG